MKLMCDMYLQAGIRKTQWLYFNAKLNPKSKFLTLMLERFGSLAKEIFNWSYSQEKI